MNVIYIVIFINLSFDKYNHIYLSIIIIAVADRKHTGMGNCLHGLYRMQVVSISNDYMCNDTALKDGNSKTSKLDNTLKSTNTDCVNKTANTKKTNLLQFDSQNEDDIFENDAYEKQRDNKFEIADVAPLDVDVSKFETSDDQQNVYRPETDYKYSSLKKDSPKPSIDQQSYPSHENSASRGTIDDKNKQIVS